MDTLTMGVILVILALVVATAYLSRRDWQRSAAMVGTLRLVKEPLDDGLYRGRWEIYRSGMGEINDFWQPLWPLPGNYPIVQRMNVDPANDFYGTEESFMAQACEWKSAYEAIEDLKSNTRYLTAEEACE